LTTIIIYFLIIITHNGVSYTAVTNFDNKKAHIQGGPKTGLL